MIGRKSVLEFLKHRASDALECFVAKNVSLPCELKKRLETDKIKINIVDRTFLFHICDDDNHQGVILKVKEHALCTIHSIIEKSLGTNGTGLIVICDHIEDPQNLGAIIRTSEASGADGVIITKARSAPLSYATQRASAGASCILPIAQVTNMQRALRTLKESGFWVVGLTLHENTTDLFSSDIALPCAVVLGSEGTGLKQLTAKECDTTILIPMQGKIESLNVSQAASVFLFEMLRRRLLKKR